MKYCCDGFGSHHAKCGTRGLSTSVSEQDGRAVFWLWCRAVDGDGEHIFDGIDLSVPVTLKTRYPIVYCPWCGKRLARFYAKTWQDMAAGDPEAEATESGRES